MGGVMSSWVLMDLLGWGYMLEGQFTHLYIYLFALVFGMMGLNRSRKVRQRGRN